MYADKYLPVCGKKQINTGVTTNIKVATILNVGSDYKNIDTI
jgi:hypothetical protein